MTLKRYVADEWDLTEVPRDDRPEEGEIVVYKSADVDAHLKEVEDAHKNQLSCMTDTQAYMEDRAHMEQENENLHFELSALKEQHENEDKNEYRPWESEGITELAYWKKRHIEQSREIAVAHDRGWNEAMGAVELEMMNLLTTLTTLRSELSALKEQHKR